MLNRLGQSFLVGLLAATGTSFPPGVPEAPQGVPGPAPTGPDRPARDDLRRLSGPHALDLEDAVRIAGLVIVVRLVDVQETKIVHGGKQEVVTEQYSFEPVRTLKGVFARDSLLLTGADLRLDRYSRDQGSIEPGQLHLLLLGRAGPGFFNCNSAGTLGQSIPRLRTTDDPLLAAVEVLIAVTQEPDRLNRVDRLAEGLKGVDGPAAIPLMTSLGRRALLAAGDPDAVAATQARLADPDPVIRQVAADTLRSMIEAAGEAPTGFDADTLAGAIGTSSPDLQARLAALMAAAALGPVAESDGPVIAALDADRPRPTFAEQAAWLRAVARTRPPSAAAAAARQVEELPLDAPEELVRAAFTARIAFDSASAAADLADRADRRLEAGLDMATELDLLGDVPADAGAPALIGLARWPLAPDEQLALVRSAGRLAGPALVPVLTSLLSPDHRDIRQVAVGALIAIDSPEAARALWPHLAEEPDLAAKLRLAAFLGRHGYRGGYPYALEHLSDPGLQELALDALAAIRHPDAVAELDRIWLQSNDLGWTAAAMRGLARLGHDRYADGWLAIASDPSRPLAPAALLALADLGDPRAVPLLRGALDSRSDRLATAAARASALLLQGRPDDPIADRLAEILADSQASPDLRSAALDALLALDSPALHQGLPPALRDAGLEGSPLQHRLELLARDRRAALPAPEG